MLTENYLREALRACFDPQLACNIVDLGLVHTIDLAPDPHAPGAGIPGVPDRQSLTLTLLAASDDDGYRAQLLATVRNRLGGLPELSRSTLVIAEQPRWSPSLLSPDGRRALNLDQPHFPILNNRLR